MKKVSTPTGSLSAEKRKLLELRLRQKGISTLETQAIPRRKEMGSCPLSFAQQRLWFLDQLEPESASYLIPRAWRFRGKLSSKTLEKSLEELIRRHESLRTTFPMQLGQPVQVIHPADSRLLPVIDLQGLRQEQREVVARSLVKQEAQLPCNLVMGPLLRMYLLCLKAQDHVLLLTLHHIITDGWSNEILIRELVTLYHAFMMGQSSPLAPLSIQYADYALWQRERLRDEVLEQQLAYWKQQLQGAPPILTLPTDYPRSSVQILRGAAIAHLMPLSLCEQLKALGQQEGVTLFTTLMSALVILLGRYSGQQDIVIGTAVANRERTELEEIVGFFANTLALRYHLAADASMRELVHQVHEVTMQAYAHQDLPFEKVVEELQVERSLSHHPLFQVMFILHNQEKEQSNLSDVQISPFMEDNQTAKRDLAIAITETPEGLGMHWQYDTALFTQEAMQRMLNHYLRILQLMVDQPQCEQSKLSLLSQQERDLVLTQWNAAQHNPSTSVSIMQWFDARVTSTPDTIALVYDQQHLSYRGLAERANRVGHTLQRLGVGSETRVGLCLERSLELLIGLFGILKAGAAYVPLDPSYPPERLTFVVQDAYIDLLLTQQHLRDRFSLLQVHLLCLDTEWGDLAAEPVTPPQVAIALENLAYVIYTSGSTGQPKGVMVTHNNVNQYVHALHHNLYITGQDAYLHTASFSFSSSVRQIMLPLSQGAKVVLASSEQIGDPLQLFTFIQQQCVSVLDLVPSYWHNCIHLLLSLPLAERDRLLDNSVRLLVTASEPLSPVIPLQWMQQLAHPAALINMFGQTETTGIVATYPLKDPQQEMGASIPIGRPIACSQLYLFDDANQLVPIGVRGEIYVGGSDLARGYLGRPELTAERFVPHPFSSKPGERLYRTGDMARYRSDDTIEFLSRIDQQVKLRGYRVEPGEIEAVLTQHPAIKACVVLVREDVSEESCLVAYPIFFQGYTLTARDLRFYLQDRLPSYMIPSAFVPLDALPLTPNGKVDRRKLPLPEEKQDKVYEETKTQIEELVVGLWSEVLGRSQVGIHENFFELGGHSLLATRLVARIAATLKVEVPVRTIFEEQTAARLASKVEQILRKYEGGVQIPPLIAGVRPEKIPLSFAQQRLWFLDQLQPGSTAYLVPHIHYLPGSLNTEALERSLEATIHQHESLRTTFTIHRGQPIQIIHPAGHYRLPLVDLCGLTQEQREREGRKLAAQEMQIPCDLATGPLLRTHLLRFGDEEHVLLLTLHHIITDGWSNRILIKEVITLYQAFVQGQPLPVAHLPIQYADYALWQRQWLQGEMLEAQLSYWTGRLGRVPLIKLPTDYPPPSVASTRGASHPFTLSAELSQALKALSRQENMTLFMALLAAFQILFYRYTKQTDIIIGTDSANRNRVETEEIVGFFVNLLVLRTDLSGRPTFRDVLKRVREVTLGAYARQDTPFELLIEKLASDHYLDRIPLIQVLFVLQNIPLEIELSRAVQQVEHKATDQRPTAPVVDRETEVKFDLTLFMWERDGRLSGTLNYRLDLFKAPTIATMIARFEALLRSSVRQPDMPIDLLDINLDTEITQKKQERQKRQQELHVLNDEWFDLPAIDFNGKGDNG